MVKKISHKKVRRRMKMNELVEAEHWLERIWREHSQKITWSLVGIVVVVLAVYLFAQKQERERVNAASVFTEALEKVNSETPEEALTLTDQVIDKYSGNAVKGPALLLKGNMLYKQEDYSGAIEVYEKLAGGGKPTLAAQAHLSMAACYESLEQPEKAEQSYRKVMESYPASGFSQAARFELAKLLERQQRPEEAVVFYQEIPEDSPYYEQAQDRVEWINAPVVALQ
jgi:tetratricopeptide (TPR) repeat protein